MKNPSLCIFIFLFAICHSDVMAGISLQTTIYATPVKDGVNVRLEVANNGDENVWKAHPEILFNEIKKEEMPVDYIPPNTTFRWESRIPAATRTLARGSYPLLVTLHYHDGNEYPFSLVGVTGVNISNPDAVVPVMVACDAATIDDRHFDIRIEMVNPFSQPLSGKVRLHGPVEIVGTSKARLFNMPQGKGQTFDFKLENIGALPDSRYDIYGVAQFEIDGQARTQICRTDLVTTYAKDNTHVLGQVFGCAVFILVLFSLTVYVELKKVHQKK